MRKTTKELNLNKALWENYTLWVIRNYLRSNADLINENIITKEGHQLYLSKLNLIKYIVMTDEQFMERWKKFHIKASKEIESDNSLKRIIISALYKKIREEKFWVERKNQGIAQIYSSNYRVGKKDNTKRNQKKYKDYPI
jgi:hypothetical protein